MEVKLGHKISEFDNNILWDAINKKGKKDGLLELTYGYSGSDIERGTRVAILKAINTELLTYDLFYGSLKLVGGTASHVERQDILSNTKRYYNRSKKYEEKRRDLPSPPEI